MQYARLGGTGLLVSRLAFGTMTFGEGRNAMAAVAKVDRESATRLVGQALDAGVNYFNTADVYALGRSEEFLGQALGERRADAVISTKVGYRTGEGLIQQGLSKRHILSAADASLKRLGTDWIDVYVVHIVDPYTPLEETLEALQHLVIAGKVRYIGFSNWPAWLAAKAVGIQRAHGWEPFRAAEMYYSLVGRDVEMEIIPFALDAGIGLQVWSPLAGGFLSGRYTADDPTGDAGRLSTVDYIPFDRKRGYTLIERLKEMARRYEVTVAQVSLAWLMTRSGVASVLVGASKPDQLATNLAAADLTLDTRTLAELDEMTAPYVTYPAWHNKRRDRQVSIALR
jgi:aryl-alcohol dehydrogenase-like predicted oxidoreductase